MNMDKLSNAVAIRCFSQGKSTFVQSKLQQTNNKIRLILLNYGYEIERM
jgi:hypothetical protein